MNIMQPTGVEYEVVIELGLSLAVILVFSPSPSPASPALPFPTNYSGDPRDKALDTDYLQAFLTSKHEGDQLPKTED